MTECSRCGFSPRRTARHIDQVSPYEAYLGPHSFPKPAPPQTLASKVKCFVQVIKTELQQCDADIARLEAALQQVKKERHMGQTLLDRHRYLLSSFHDLPPEVMVHIFMLCGYDDVGTFKIHTTHCAPWQLERVCSRWRNIVRTTPSIWKSFGVRYPASLISRVFSRPNYPLVSRLNDALVKSQPLPLHIRVDLSSLSDDLTKTLFDHSSRWGTMAFEGSNTDYVSLPRLGVLSMPIMTKLTLTILSYHGPVVYLDHTIKSFIQCPGIRELSLTTRRETRWSSDPSSLLFPWYRLTKLVLDFKTDLSPVRPLVECCINLQTLEVTSLDNLLHQDMVTPDVEAPVRHSKITSLTVKNSLDLLSRIDCPALLHLSVSDTSFRHKQHFLRFASCSLTCVELFIPDSFSPDGRPLIMIPQLSAVVELILHLSTNVSDPEEPDKLLLHHYASIIEHSLTLTATSVPFPKLQTLSLHFPYHLVRLPEDGSMGTLMSVIESRWNVPEMCPARRLRTLNLVGGRVSGFQSYYMEDNIHDGVTVGYVDERDELRRKFDGSALMKAARKLKDEGLAVCVTGIVTNYNSLWKESFETYL